MSAPLESSTPMLPVASAAQVRSACWALLRHRWWLLVVALLSFVISAACALVLPYALGQVVDLVAEGRGTASDVWLLAGAMAAAAVIWAAMFAVGAFTTARLVEGLLAGLREDLVYRSLRLPPRVVERSGSGDLVARSSDDVAMVSEALPTSVPVIASSTVMIALTAVGMGLLNPWFALTFVVVAPVHIWAVRWYLRTAPEVYAAERAALAVRAQHLLAALRALPTVQAFSMASVHTARITHASWSAVRWAMRTRAVQNTLFARLNLAEFFGMATILVTGFVLVGSDRATVGATTTAMLFFLQLFGPINGLLFMVDSLQSALASLARIVGVRFADQDEPELRSVGSSKPLRASQVEFGYGTEPVVRAVDLHIDAGERVALVGSSGAGKSTVAALVAGIHRPWSGQIGVSAPVAAATVLISQEVHVFGGSVWDNLTLGAQSASEEDVTQALRLVGAEAMVGGLPDGVHTQVGPHGRELTVAQAQLLALARAHLARPELVLLDEATAEAGSMHGGILDAAARAVMSGRAGLIIAHRLDQAADADRIVVMDAGRVVEVGSHTELIAAGGTYATLWGAWERHRGNGQPT